MSRLGLYELTDDDERDMNALEPLLNLPNLFEPPDPEEDDGFPGDNFAWRRVLRREEDRRFRQRIENYLEVQLRQREGHGDGALR